MSKTFQNIIFMIYFVSAMENYYTDLIKNLNQAIEDNDFDKALSMLDEEFKMPYIPMDIEKELLEIKKSIPVQDKPRQSRIYDEDEIINLLAGNPEQNMIALDQLKDANIRKYLPVLQEYLLLDNPRILKSIAITLLMDQQIRDEVTMEDQGNTYTFIPAAIWPPEESEGFEKAWELLKEILEKENPSSANIAFEVLLKECYLKLPEAYDEDEAEMLAFGVLKAVLEGLGNTEDWERYIKEYNINPDRIMNINL